MPSLAATHPAPSVTTGVNAAQRFDHEALERRFHRAVADGPRYQQDDAVPDPRSDVVGQQSTEDDPPAAGRPAGPPVAQPPLTLRPRAVPLGAGRREPGIGNPKRHAVAIPGLAPDRLRFAGEKREIEA